MDLNILLHRLYVPSQENPVDAPCLILAVVTLRTFALGNIVLPREILPEYTRGKCISGFIFPR